MSLYRLKQDGRRKEDTGVILICILRVVPVVPCGPHSTFFIARGKSNRQSSQFPQVPRHFPHFPDFTFFKPSRAVRLSIPAGCPRLSPIRERVTTPVFRSQFPETQKHGPLPPLRVHLTSPIYYNTRTPLSGPGLVREWSNKSRSRESRA